MPALRKTRPGFGRDLFDGTEPPNTVSVGEVTVRVQAAGICGSDVHACEWSGGYGFMVPHLPIAMGHEFAGHAPGSSVAGRGVVGSGRASNRRSMPRM